MNIQDLHRGINPNTGTEGMFAKTNTGGIDARTLAVCGKATDVIRCYIGTDGTITESSVRLTVYNPFSSAVAGDTYITIKRVAGHWIVDAEDCGE